MVESAAVGLPRRYGSGMAVRKDMRMGQLKSLATKTVAWPYASAPSIHYNRAGQISTGERHGQERGERAGASSTCGARRAEWMV
jgi:hypothetical protein